MDEVTRRVLNPTETILQNIPAITEAFVTFYGEEERENITRKFTNMEIIGYYSLYGLKTLVELEERAPHKDEQKYQMEIAPYKQLVNRIEENAIQAHLKYPKMLFESAKKLFKKEEYEAIKERNYAFDGYQQETINKKIENYITYNKGAPLIEAFGLKATMKLQNGNPIAKESIIKDRIKYFNNLGINLGDDYTNYLKDKRVKKYMPSNKTAAALTTNQEKQKIWASYLQPHYQENIEKIERLNLIDKNYGYDETVHKESELCGVLPNIKLENGKYILYPLIIIPTLSKIFNKGSFGGLDNCVVHELNHLFELNINSIDIKKQIYIYTTGFENIKVSKKTTSNRRYMYFSEIINELITKDIMTILSQTNHYIFETEETKFTNTNHTSIYELYEYLVEEFYKTYKKEIIESRKSGNMDILYNAVGKENFEALNQLVNMYMKKIYPHRMRIAIEYENLNRKRLIKSLEDRKSGKKTTITDGEELMKEEAIFVEKIRALEEPLISKRDAILENMREHYQTKRR